MEKQRLFKLTVTFVLILYIGVPNCHALVNRALYTIENIGSKQVNNPETVALLTLL